VLEKVRVTSYQDELQIREKRSVQLYPS